MRDASPLVTIITPAYNRAAFLDETIESVLSQDYPNIEYIVLDDGSKDNTQQVLEKYRGRIILESHSNIGETRTVNKGFDMAKGEMVCVVNSDDPLLPNAISASVVALQECPDVLAVYPDWNEIGPNSEFIQRRQLPEYNILNMLTDFNVSIGPGVFIRQRAIEQFGMRDTEFKYTGDLEYWFRLALRGKLIHIPQTLATHRVHPEAASLTDRGAQMADELVRIVQKIYAQPNVPLDIKRIRKYVFGHAHYVATYYCGNNQRALIRHLFMSFVFDPLNSPKRIMSHGKLFLGFLKTKLRAN